ncbi:MAG: dTDP-4-dehydrorhamnose reductase [Bacteroidales bacterium]|jgi:dTDP-4-dehydrorhamnose reductase|nr:dTDP-4-dehydrorhamnose reductase [Bacteroidales bacterium]MBQ7610123.1 dTDP-4-dehydrorhamnose reductase [Bacteroidales bacterium]MBR1637488.1 dTDP-4-dehydrorhamnose reductase [Bacteroidales bacterium]
MNILVTGANGQLGTELRNVSAGSRNRYIFTDVNELPGVETLHLDATDLDAVRIVADTEGVDAIINCAAYTNVDGAESDHGLCDLLNRQLPANLAAIARERNALLVHISTDYVFGGNASVPYREDSVPDPTGVYGATKLLGENAILSSGCRYLILRTAWLYSPYGKNFVKTMLRLTAERDSLKVVFDQVGTPTYAEDLARVIVDLVDGGKVAESGIYHYTNEGVTSWYDFALAICQLGGNRCDIQPCHSDEFPSKVHRPHYSVLDKTKIKNTFSLRIPYWLDSLERCVERLKG